MMLNIMSKSYRDGKQKETKNDRQLKKIHCMSIKDRMPIEWPKLEGWSERHRMLWMLRTERR